MLMDPEGNIKLLKEMLQICKDKDQELSILGLKSLLAVFKDIIPGYIYLISRFILLSCIHVI